MAAIVMWKHKKRLAADSMKPKHTIAWLKTVASLTVVMGVTWLIGVLIVDVDELVPLAYIFTIMVAFQGVWIFLLFVVFPKQVRDDYVKLWRTQVKGSDRFSSFFGKNTLPTQVVRK